MPFVQGLREYYYYHEEISDDEEVSTGYSTFEEKQAWRLSKVPSYNQVETLEPVVKALQELPKQTYNSSDDEYKSQELDEKGQGDASEDDKEPEQFYAEDSFSPLDIKITVEEVGELSFPLEDETIQKLIGVSSKAKFGSRTEELLDKQVRDTQTILASDLKVEIKDDTISMLMNKMKNGLNISEKCTLEPHLYNMLIYTKGQFFDWHRDTEKIENMVATMVLVLPSDHEGGDLYVKHGYQNHSFSSSENMDRIKCITFYSDCEHRVYSVQSGYRIVLTYNVELQYPAIPESMVLLEVDPNLSSAVADHFAHTNSPKRLTVFLLHGYSEKSLKWHMIKGRDRTYTRALLAVAKQQDLIPCLALASCFESWEASECHGPVRSDAFVRMHYWVDEHGMKLDKFLVLGYDEMAKEVCTFRKEFWHLGEPDKEETLGWYGNSPAIREQWYYKACVVLLKK